MLLEKSMIYQLLDAGTIIGVLLEAAIQKISYFSTHKQVWGYFDLIFDYFDEFLFPGYFEWILSDNHLIHHDADGPDIYFLIILSSFEYFWGDVERSSTKGRPQFIVLMNWPSEITQFDDILSITQQVHREELCSKA